MPLVITLKFPNFPNKPYVLLYMIFTTNIEYYLLVRLFVFPFHENK